MHLSAMLTSGIRRRAAVWVLISFVALPSCKSGRSIDRTSAKKVSDDFMTYLASDRVGDAVNEMEPELFHGNRRIQFENQMRKLFDYCGRPLDSEFKHDEIGFRLYPNGRQKPMRKFYYAANTTQYRKGVCFFAVEVVPEQNSLKVANFGPMKLLSGQLPDYLR